MADRSSLHEEKVVFETLLDVSRRGTLWAVLDACDSPDVQEKVEQLGATKAVSLYKGKGETDYWAIAPYLARADEELLKWIKETLWTEPWGFFAEATSDLEKLRTHFRRFLTVQGPGGKKMYFRFYDPRVLRTFLKSSDEAELMEFFGPVERMVVESEGGKRTELDGFAACRSTGAGVGSGAS
jgi:hypothetical protein